MIYYFSIFIIFCFSFYKYKYSLLALIFLNIYLYFSLYNFKIKYHRRGYLLYLTSLFLSSLLFFNKYLCFFIVIINYFIIPITNLILLPFEKRIQKKYLNMAKDKLRKINPIIIGITGSFGKTTFKEYLYSLLKNKFITYKSKGNYNTLMGLTKFINQELNNDCEILILEMGIDENHGILKYQLLTSLDIAIITGVGKVHLATFKNFDNIINSKCEIDLLLKETGVLFYNGEYQELKNHKFLHKNFAYNNDLNLSNNLNIFQKMTVNGVKLIADYFHIEEKYFTYFLNNLPPVKRRFEIKNFPDGIVINDSYNINENGFKESIKYISSLNGIKIVITGGLIELGKEYFLANYNLGLSMKNIDYLFLITKDKKHPLSKGYLTHHNKLFKVKSLKKCYKIINQIKGYKIILISAKGCDYFLH